MQIEIYLKMENAHNLFKKFKTYIQISKMIVLLLY
jgi:hypothetical protein